jgi:4'-phosphopantetheinyl transferase
MLEIVVAPLDVDTAPLERLLTPDERQRAARFVFERDRRRFIAARARLRRLLGERLGVPPDSVELAYGAHGKPPLGPRHGRDLRFSVSHSRDVAVYAFADGADVGTDVEALRELDDADAIATRCFSQGEYQAYRSHGFFYCWTRKEAYLKALGLGLEQDLRNLDTSRPPRGWRMESFAPAPGYVAALAVEERAGLT